jgi:hypothetical protein
MQHTDRDQHQQPSLISNLSNNMKLKLRRSSVSVVAGDAAMHCDGSQECVPASDLLVRVTVPITNLPAFLHATETEGRTTEHTSTI